VALTSAKSGSGSGRPRLIQACIDAFQQPDVREKLLFTFAMLVVYRFLAHVPLPNVNQAGLTSAFQNNALLGFINVFSGNTLRRLSVAALGVYPYITAQIVLQILIPIVPRLQALSKEGEQGQKRIQLYANYLTVPLALVQGYLQLEILAKINTPAGPALRNFGLFDGSTFLPTIATLASVVAGTLFLVWIGELITERGIGNGVSIIIFAGIVAGIPSLAGNNVFSAAGVAAIMLLAVIAFVMLFAIVIFNEATRRIPVQYSRSVFRGGRMYRQSGQTYIPLKVNSAGMIPLLFAFSGMLIPSFIAQYLATSSNGTIRDIANWLRVAFSPNGVVYQLLVFFLVVAFTFFYTLIIFQQQNLAENLQKQGGFIPGIRPGRPTAEYINRVLFRITWAGAIFLGVISIIPFLATRLTGVQSLQITATGMLIVVGVVIDTMKQLEAQLLMRNYEGFIR
jgi:preprotein translocase subunit SecY